MISTEPEADAVELITQIEFAQPANMQPVLSARGAALQL